MQDIVFESLRLYPPTKRIYRQNCENGELFAVDVEYLQRSKDIWGIHGNDFKPDRWWILEREDAAYKEAWMPFGKGSFQCPASKVAPMMIGVLVGCLLDTFGNDKWVLEEGDREEILGRGPLDNGREAFEGLLLRRIESDE